VIILTVGAAAPAALSGIQLEPASSWALYEVEPDHPRNYRRPAYPQVGKDGWWRPTWPVGPPKMHWEEFLALPDAERPL
jgi:hypothetical protein